MTKKVHHDNNISWNSISKMEQFLTSRWNNWLTLALGIPALIYGIVILSTLVLSDFWGFIGLVVIGAAY